MEFIHDRKSNILFSLYGSKVNRIKIHNKTLTLTVEEMYQLLDGEEKHSQEKYVLTTVMWICVRY